MNRHFILLVSTLLVCCFICLPCPGQTKKEDSKPPELLDSFTPEDSSWKPSNPNQKAEKAGRLKSASGTTVDIPSSVSVEIEEAYAKDSWRDDFLKVFAGEQPWPWQDELAKQMAIRVRTYQSAPSGFTKLGTPNPKVGFQSQAVDPNDPELTPEQKLGVGVVFLESLISKTRQKLLESNESEQSNEMLSELERLYGVRFELDTAYQDFKVSEVERRAKKLREGVTARDKEKSEWVQAMVTLSRMQARGIETMSPGPIKLPTDEDAMPIPGLTPMGLPPATPGYRAPTDGRSDLSF